MTQPLRQNSVGDPQQVKRRMTGGPALRLLSGSLKALKTGVQPGPLIRLCSGTVHSRENGRKRLFLLFDHPPSADVWTARLTAQRNATELYNGAVQIPALTQRDLKSSPLSELTYTEATHHVIPLILNIQNGQIPGGREWICGFGA